MKVLLMNLNGRGGMLHYGSQFSNALKNHADIRVVVPSYADTSHYRSDIILWKIRTNPTLGSFILDSINIFEHISLLKNIWTFRPEIIQILDNHPWYFFYPLFGKLIGAKIYVVQHDPFPHSGEQRGVFHTVAIWVNAFLRKVADRLIVHGGKMREKVIKNYKIPSEKVVSIYHGSLELFETKKTDSEKQENTFLFFGRIVEYKGLDIFLEALKLLEDEKVPYHAIIAGDGDFSPYREQLGQLQEKNMTVINRFIEDHEIYSLFHRSEFVVLPYRDATASGVIPLAYSFALPVIASDVGVLSEYVVHEKTGLLIPPNDPKILKNAIIKLLLDKNTTKILGENAYIHQKEYFSWESVMKKIYRVAL